MTKFIAYVNQTDNGCDYTIGCGHDLLHLYADNIKDAEQELREWIAYDYEDDPNDLQELLSITLFEVSTVVEIPLNQWYRNAKAEKKAEKNQEVEQKERLELIRLKEKYR